MKRLFFRCRYDRKFRGVIAAFARVFRCDPNALRLAVIFGLCTPLFPLIVGLYILLWVLLPEGQGLVLYIETKRLYRARHNRRIAGVCAGIAHYFSVDPLLIRLLMVITFFFSLVFPVVVTYVAAVVLLPEENSY